eukprot:m.29815 g.29815  ORF g.29815 m.29815 type:complete len:183 (+) comp8138_c0_seq2:222-770(+)
MNKFAFLLAFALVAASVAQNDSGSGSEQAREASGSESGSAALREIEDESPDSSVEIDSVESSSKKGKKNKSPDYSGSGVLREMGDSAKTGKGKEGKTKEGKKQKKGKSDDDDDDEMGKGHKSGLMQVVAKNAAGFAGGSAAMIGVLAAAMGFSIRRRNAAKASKENSPVSETTPLTYGDDLV